MELINIYLVKQIEKCLENPQYAFGILGPKGYGKSSIVKETAENMGFKIIDIRLSSAEETDLGGLPRVINDKYYDYMAPKWIYDLCNDTENKYLIMLDEMNQALPEVLNAIFPLILASVNNEKVERHLAGLKIPDTAAICVLGNTEEDNPYLTELPEALTDRIFWLPFEAKIKHYKKYLINKHGTLADNFFKTFETDGILNPRQIDRFLWLCKNRILATKSDEYKSIFIKNNFTNVSDFVRDLVLFYENLNKKSTGDKKFNISSNSDDDWEFLEKLE